MKENVKKRIELVKDTDDMEVLKKHLCPFYELGDHPDCRTCRKTEDDLIDCRDYYLERISTIPLEIWDDSFDRPLIQKRATVSAEEVTGIGINCDSCYMSDKCPLFKRGYVCGIKWDNDRPSNPTEFLDFLVNTQYERVKRAAVFEKIDGGVPDAGLSGEMDRLTSLVETKVNMGRERLSINVEATGAASSGGGILAKLFGGTPATETPKTIAIPEKPSSREGIEDVTVLEEPEKIKVRRKKNDDG